MAIMECTRALDAEKYEEACKIHGERVRFNEFGVDCYGHHATWLKRKIRGEEVPPFAEYAKEMKIKELDIEIEKTNQILVDLHKKRDALTYVAPPYTPPPEPIRETAPVFANFGNKVCISAKELSNWLRQFPDSCWMATGAAPPIGVHGNEEYPCPVHELIDSLNKDSREILVESSQDPADWKASDKDKFINAVLTDLKKRANMVFEWKNGRQWTLCEDLIS